MSLVRTLLRSPLFTATVVLTFAVSTAVVAITFALVWHILVRQLPFPEAERLVFVWNRYGAEKPESSALSAPDFDDRRKARSFASAAVWQPAGTNLTDGEPERLNAARVTGDFFRVLGATAAVGQTFTRTDEQVAVVSDALWRRRFGARRDIAGTTIRLNDRPYRVAGVMPARFAFPKRDVDIWLPLHLTAEDFADTNRGNEYYAMIARLRPGVTMAQAEAEMGVIDRAVIGRVPERRKWLEDSRWHVSVFGVRDDLVRRNRTSLLVLFGAALLVPLLAAANVAGLFMARATSRQREVAVRAALGAGKWQIARELSSEVVTLAAAGALLAVLLARAAVPWMTASGLPRAEEINIGPAVIGTAFGSALLTALAIGLAISMWAWRTAASGDRGGTASRGTARVRSVLVAAQVAIAVTLVATGALLVETWRRLKTVDLGFSPRSVVTARVELPRVKYESPAARRAFFTELQQRLAALPGVAAASATSDLPLSENDWTATFDVTGRDPSLQNPSGHIRVVQSGYTETMRIPTLRGRTFTAGDRDGAAQVAMIDDVAARLYWPGQDPVGRTLAFGDEVRTVVGVVGAVRHGTPGEDAQPHVYFPMLQKAERSMYVVMRTSGDAERVGADLRAIVRSMDAAQPIFAVQTMDEYLDRAVEQPRMRATLVGAFAAVGLMLAVLGLYGLLVFTVAARTREVGIRMALGARASQIVTFVGRWSFAVTAAGIGVGLTGAVLMTGTMQAMLFGVDQLRGRVYFAVALLFALVAAVASIIPAARAARIDPAVALRHD